MNAAAADLPSPMARLLARVVPIGFFVSGASALTLEVLWVRQFSLVFGSTMFAIATVVGTFMGGLALGAAWVGRRLDRLPDPLAWYARLELVVGIYALALPLLIAALRPLYAVAWVALDGGFVGMSLVRFVGSAVVLLIPTTCMGATLPLLTGHAMRTLPDPGRVVGRLYALNTAGAVVGCVAGGLLLLPAVGEMATLVIAAGTDLVIGFGLLALRRAAGGEPGPLAEAANEGGRLTGGQADRQTANPAPADLSASPPLRLQPRIPVPLLLAFALAGAAGMAWQCAWTRLLTLVVGSSVYAFAIILACFLTAIAAGSAAATRWVLPRVNDDLGAAANGLVYAAAAALLAAYAYVCLPFGFVHVLGDGRLPWLLVAGIAGGAAGLTAAILGRSRDPLKLLSAGLGCALAVLLADRLVPVALPGRTYAADVTASILMASAVVGLPMFLSGAAFPLLVRGATPVLGDAGRRVGACYAANTVGAIVGTLAAGFVGIPAIGILGTVLAGAGLAMAAAVGAARVRGECPSRGWRQNAGVVGVGVLGIAVILPPEWNAAAMSSGAYMYGTPEEWPTLGDFLAKFDGRTRRVLSYAEGVTATVTVMRAEDTQLGTYLSINGKRDASSLGDMPTQVLGGHLPMLLAPRTDRVLVVGCGSGVTADAASRHAPSRLVCAELEDAVVRATRWFRHVNGDLYARARRGELTLVAEDARNYLLANPEPWDVIISEPSHPWVAGCGKLFTAEFFALARARLAADGVFAQWLQIYNLEPEAVQALLRTLRTAFPHVLVFATIPGSDLIIVASGAPLAPDLARLRARAARPAVAAQLARLQLVDPLEIFSYLVCDDAGATRFAPPEGPHNTDDNAWVEYRSARALRVPGMGRATRPQLEAAGAGSVERVAEQTAEPTSVLNAAARGVLRRADQDLRGRLSVGLFRQALGMADAAVARGGGADALLTRGEARLALDLHAGPAAMDDWVAALAAAPGHAGVRRRIAAHRLEVDFPEEAIPDLEALVAADPADDAARVLLGKALVESQRFAPVEVVCAPVIARDPGMRRPTARLWLGVARLRQGDATAVEPLAAYLDADPDDPRARRDYAAALRLSGRPEEADRQLAACNGQDAAAAAATQASQAYDAERFAEAEGHWHRAIARYPYAPRSHESLVLLQLVRGELGRARDALRDMRRHFPQAWWPAMRLAYLLDVEGLRCAAAGDAPGAAAARAEAVAVLRAVLPTERDPLVVDELEGRIRDLEDANAGR